MEFTTANGIALAGLLFTIFSAIVMVWWNLNKRLEQHTKEIAEFKLDVAERYATMSMVSSIEAKLSHRMDVLTEQIQKLPDQIADRLIRYMKLRDFPDS